jgi:hypothetical protein
MKTYQVGPRVHRRRAPGSDRTHSTTIRRYPGILGTLPVVFATTEGVEVQENGRTGHAGVDLWDYPSNFLAGAGRQPPPTTSPRI